MKYISAIDALPNLNLLKFKDLIFELTQLKTLKLPDLRLAKCEILVCR